MTTKILCFLALFVLAPGSLGCGSIAAFQAFTQGNVNYLAGEYDQAIADYTRAIELDPEMAGAYYNRGRAHNELGEFNQAIADYTKAIELDPKDELNTYYYRGLAFKQKGLSSKAIEDFETYLQLNPNADDRAQVEQLIREIK